VIGDAGGLGTTDGDERDDIVRLVRLAGVLLLTGSLFSIPGGLVLEPQPALYKHVLALVGTLVAGAFLLAPAARIGRAWIYAALGVGTVLIGIGVAIFSDDYAFFYVVTAIYAALALPDRRELAVYMALLTAALLAPLVYDDSLKQQLHHILVTLPVLFISVFCVRYLRETLLARERMYRGFARDAVDLALRIRRSSAGAEPGADEGIRELQRLQELAASPNPPEERL
jgi:hypothetical protein